MFDNIRKTPPDLRHFPPILAMSAAPSTAWVEPGTASLILYGVILLARGRAGSRMLARQLRRESETLAELALQELGDFMYDHPSTLLMALLVLSACGSNSPLRNRIAPRCRAPGLLRLARVFGDRRCPGRARGLDQLLHPVQRHHSAGFRAEQAQANPDKPEPIRPGPLPSHPPCLSVLLRRAGRAKCPALRLLRQLAAAGVQRRQEEAGGSVAVYGSRGALHAAAGNDPLS